MATYPSSVKVFTTKTNVTDIVDASHPNSVQDEIVAIESTIGSNPQISTAPSPSGTFAGTSVTYADLVARLANIRLASYLTPTPSTLENPLTRQTSLPLVEPQSRV